MLNTSTNINYENIKWIKLFHNEKKTNTTSRPKMGLGPEKGVRTEKVDVLTPCIGIPIESVPKVGWRKAMSFKVEQR